MAAGQDSGGFNQGTAGQVGTIVFTANLETTLWRVSGLAQGGDIAFEIFGVWFFLQTSPGQTADDVAASIADAILANTGLDGIAVSAVGPDLTIHAPVNMPVSSDPGISIGNVVTAVPLFSSWAFVVLAFMLLAMGHRALSGKLLLAR